MFNTFEHNILLRKLVINGIREKCLYCFEIYQKRRHQFVSLGKTINTTYDEIICGVAHASIVWLLFFLIYIKGLFRSSTKLTSAMFADNTKLFILDFNTENPFKIMNDEINNVSTWFRANKLDLIGSTSKYSLFHSTGKEKYTTIYEALFHIKNVSIVTNFLKIFQDEMCSGKTMFLYKSHHLLNSFLLKPALLFSHKFLSKWYKYSMH